MAVRPEAAERLTPHLAGWFAAETPAASYGGPLRLAAGARRLRHLAGLVQLGRPGAGARAVRALGIEAIHEHDVGAREPLPGRARADARRLRDRVDRRPRRAPRRGCAPPASCSPTTATCCASRSTCTRPSATWTGRCGCGGECAAALTGSLRIRERLHGDAVVASPACRARTRRRTPSRARAPGRPGRSTRRRTSAIEQLSAWCSPPPGSAYTNATVWPSGAATSARDDRSPPPMTAASCPGARVDERGADAAEAAERVARGRRARARRWPPTASPRGRSAPARSRRRARRPAPPRSRRRAARPSARRARSPSCGRSCRASRRPRCAARRPRPSR